MQIGAKVSKSAHDFSSSMIMIFFFLEQIQKNTNPTRHLCIILCMILNILSGIVKGENHTKNPAYTHNEFLFKLAKFL
jgi:uncharacterized membrane protein